MDPPISVTMSSESEPPKWSTGLIGSVSVDGKLLVRNGNSDTRRPLSAPPPSEEAVSPPTAALSRANTSRSLSAASEPFQEPIEQLQSVSHDNIKPLARRGAIRHKRVTSDVVRRPFSAPQAPVLPTPGRLKIRPLRTHPIQGTSTSTILPAGTFGQESWWMALDHYVPSSTKMFSFKAKDIAVELTLIDAEMFRCIAPSEIKDAAWTKADTKYINSPNVMRMIDWFNRLARIACTEIVQEKTPSARGKAICRYIKIASQCYKLRNYNSLKAILSSLQLQAVYRLEKSWQHVPRYVKMKFDRLVRVMSEENRFEKLRYEMEKNTANKEHFIPYLAWFLNSVLTEITYAEIRQDRAKPLPKQSRDSHIKVSHSSESLQLCAREKSADPMESTSQSSATGILSETDSAISSLQDTDLSISSTTDSLLQHSPSTSLYSYYDATSLSLETAAKELSDCSTASRQNIFSVESMVAELEGSPDDSSESVAVLVTESPGHSLHLGSTTVMQMASGSSEENYLAMDTGRVLKQMPDLAEDGTAKIFNHVKTRKIRGQPRRLTMVSSSFAYQQAAMTLSLPPLVSEAIAKEQDGRTKSYVYHFPKCGTLFTTVSIRLTEYSTIGQGSERLEVHRSDAVKAERQETKVEEADIDEHSQSSSFSSVTEMINDDIVSKSFFTDDDDDDTTWKSGDSVSSCSIEDYEDFYKISQPPPKKERTRSISHSRRASFPASSMYMRKRSCSQTYERQVNQIVQLPSTETHLDRYQVWTMQYLKKHSRQNKIRTFLFSSTWLPENKCLDISLQIEPNTRS